MARLDGELRRRRAVQFRAFPDIDGRGLWALGAPVIILGGIYGGVFSPTEAAAVACVYATFVTRFVFRELTFRDIVEAAAATVRSPPRSSLSSPAQACSPGC